MLEDAARGGVTSKSLLPHEPLERAHCRHWVEQAAALIGPALKIMLAKDASDANAAIRSTREAIDSLEPQLRGSYFLGDAFCRVDLAYSTALQRLLWAERLDPSLELLGEPARSYAVRLTTRPSVVRSLPADAERVVRDRVANSCSWLAARVRSLGATS
jgi:glutathione S-transferase